MVGLVVIVLVTVGFVAGFMKQFAISRTVCQVGEQCQFVQLGPEGARAAAELGLSIDLYAAYNTAVTASFAFASLAVAALIILRRPADRGALLVATLLVMIGAIFSDLNPMEDLPGILGVIGAFVNEVDLWYFAFLLYVFPDGRFRPRWTRWLALGALAAVALEVAFPGSRLSPLSWSGIWGSILCLGSGVAAQVYRYRRLADAAQRAQIKWVVFGATVALIGFIGTVLAVSLFFPQAIGDGVRSASPAELLIDILMTTAIYGIVLLLPISIGVAIIRSRLYDIDILINRALVYGALTGALVAIYLGGVALLQRLLSPLLGRDNQLAVVASTLAIAALFQPLRRRIQSAIDRHFYRGKYDAQRTLAAFGSKLRDETDLERLGSDLVAVVEETMQPAHVSLWLRPTERARS